MQPTQLSRSIRNGIVVNFGKGTVAPAGLTRQEVTATDEEIAEQEAAQEAVQQAEQAEQTEQTEQAEDTDFDGV